jgi:hypothetical protein
MTHDYQPPLDEQIARSWQKAFLIAGKNILNIDCSALIPIVSLIQEKSKQEGALEAIEEINETWTHKGWHESDCPAHTNQMRPESECVCSFGVVYEILDDMKRKITNNE